MLAFLLAAVLVLAPFVVLIMADGSPRSRRAAARARSRRAHPAFRSPPPTSPPPTSPPPTSPPPTAEESARLEVEALLARRIVTREIDHATYHDAMAALAARDAQSRPLHVPGGGGADA